MLATESGGPAQKQYGAPGKTGPAIFALYLSEGRCSGASPKQSCLKNPNPQNGHLMARFDWGSGAVCFGASPVAAVFGSAPGSATSPKHRLYPKPDPPAVPSKQDISTLLGIGHVYLALTGQLAYVSTQNRNVPRAQSKNVPFCPGLGEVHVNLCMPVKRRRAMLASNPIEE